MKMEDFTSDPFQFAALIAHQLQGPLNAVSQALQTVLAEYAGPVVPGQRAPLERANERCGQAITAVRRMLAILKAEQTRGGQAASAPLTAVIRQVHAQQSAEAARRGIRLRTELAADGVRVQLAEPALAEVLSALLENALKYTPDGGQILIATRAGAEEGWVRIAVGDSGIGIPENVRNRIFEPFFRTEESRAGDRPGLGLGLAFVRSVVTAAGGRVAAGQAELGGAEILIDVPTAAQSGVAADEDAAATAFRVVIVGGVAAGTKAAARIVRLRPDADVTLIDRDSVLAYAGCGLPYYVSGVVRDTRSLISSPAGLLRDSVFFQAVKRIHQRNGTEAVEIDRNARRVRVRNLFTGQESWVAYDKLVLATGARTQIPEALRTPLRNVFTLHGIRDAEGIRAALAEGQARDVVIIGGGLLGIEMTESLVSKGARVTIVEKRPQILPLLDPDMARMVERHLSAHGVKVLTDTTVQALVGRDTVSAVVCERATLGADMVILAIGVTPNTDLARQAGLDIGETGGLRVDRALCTNDPDIFAAGDCVESLHLVTGRACYIPLGATANKHARVAAANLCGGNEVFPGILATCICRVFEYGVARTGLGEAEARSCGYDVVTVHAPGPDREHYMPHAAQILMKLIVDAPSRRLLGVQAIGPGAVDKRVDVAVMAIRGAQTVDDLAQADLCYAPPYSPAMDNIITAANVARNKLDGLFRGTSPDDVRQGLQERRERLLLDVRTPEEFQARRLAHSTLIPLSVLRERVGELPRDREIVTICDLGLRAYEAARILQAAGFEQVSIMEGGLAMWPFEVVS